MIDLTGQQFDRLLVLGWLPAEAKWACRCSCGNFTAVARTNLQSRPTRGPVRSCGCLYRETRRSVSRTHGLSASPEWRAWTNAKKRCFGTRPRWQGYYRDRGISMWEGWRSAPDGFLAFLEHVGPRPTPKHSLDRIDNDGDYEPGNVRWATWSEQARNRRSPLAPRRGWKHTEETKEKIRAKALARNRA